MATNTLTDRAAGQTITDAFFNDIHTALEGDFVGRDTSGVPASGQNLGNVAFPWGTVYTGAMILNGSAVDASQITSPQNRNVSGRTRTTSNQPQFLRADGVTNEVDILATATSLVLDIAGTTVTLTGTDFTTSHTPAITKPMNVANITEPNRTPIYIMSFFFILKPLLRLTLSLIILTLTANSGSMQEISNCYITS